MAYIIFLYDTKCCWTIVTEQYQVTHIEPINSWRVHHTLNSIRPIKKWDYIPVEFDSIKDFPNLIEQEDEIDSLIESILIFS
jgi:hypothetical protein